MDWEFYKKYAYGALNLKPDEFYSLTVTEFFELLEGYRWRNEKSQMDLANLAYWIVAGQRQKKAPTPNQLLGKESPQNTKHIDADEKKSTLEDLNKALGS
ncbi:hypothetical protein P9578_28365 [Brevibacillus choshinensis]|uniref:hypothetical protein n=1 Tax=Brevibacillus choshinensis TaxID=54911 RepID=UPI002E1A9808|nr:hypothetical protein [Brevibacillus choshinensis]